MDPTLENLIALVAHAAVHEPSGVTPDSTFASLGLDSLDLVELLMEVEEQFEIHLGDDSDAITTADTVNSLYQTILSAFVA